MCMPAPAAVGIFRLEMGMLLKYFINTISFPTHSCSIPWLCSHGRTTLTSYQSRGSVCLICQSFQSISQSWHTSVERMNGSINKTKTNKQKITIMGETWQHISELEKFAEKSTLLSKSLKTNGNPDVRAFLKLSQLWKVHASRPMGLCLRLFGLQNKKVLPSLVSCYNWFPCCLYQLLHFKVKDTETQRIKRSVSGLNRVLREPGLDRRPASTWLNTDSFPSSTGTLCPSHEPDLRLQYDPSANRSFPFASVSQTPKRDSNFDLVLQVTWWQNSFLSQPFASS